MRRGSHRVVDMALSLAVILIPVVIIYALFARPADPKPAAVDVGPVLAQARAAAPYRVVAPANLPPDWRATRATWTKQGDAGPDGSPAPGNTWQMAWLSPEGTYLGLAQRDVAGRELAVKSSRDGKPDGISAVAGRTWQRLASSDGRTHAIYLDDAGATTVVTGDLPYSALEAFASSLA